MNGSGFVILSSTHMPETRTTQIRVGTPDMAEVTVSVPDSLVGSAVVNEVIQRAIDVRRESIDALRPVDE